MTVRIRAATPGDASCLCAWNAAMARETEHKALDAERLRAGVDGVLTHAARGFYLVAERDGEAVGSAMVTYEWSDWRNGNFWWIQSVYVLPHARRQGVFRALHAAIAERARAVGAIGLRLYVDLDNASAQATYAALGMQRCHYALYESEF
jgi:GNAT superfamily N-acetyltransferase